MMKVTILSLVFILAASIHVHGRSIQQYIPSNWIYKCLIQCPSQPLDVCDFYFQGYHDQLPVFTYNTTSPKYLNNTVLTPPVLDKYLNRTVDIHTTSRPACYLNNKNVTKFTNIYYATGMNHVGHVLVNTTANKCDEFCGRCVLLYTVQARPHWKDGSFTQLLSGDNNPTFPEARRCVVFKTEPCY